MDSLVRQAIAKIEVVAGGERPAVRSRGTGFLVAPGLVLTALHVVANRRADPPEPIAGDIQLTFPGFETGARIHDGLWDAREDWALLDCRESPASRPIPLADWQVSGTPFETFGFPDANPRDGMVQSGRIKSHNAELEGASVYQLFSEEAAAGNGAPAKGLSGAPVIVDGAVVGLLRFALMNEQRQTVAGTVYACPVSAVIERSGDLLPIPDPCHGLPGLPRMPLPVEPFRYLQHFTERDAEIFFGRRREIRALYDLITSPDAPSLVLLYGKSGVGKSSFLDAGVLPRLAWHYDTRYLRRDPSRSLLVLLTESLLGRSADAPADATTLAGAWRSAEDATGRAVIVVLDQVEEVFTRPAAARPDELRELFDALALVMSAGGEAPRGRLIIAFRKEWLPEIQKQLELRDLAHGKVFLEGLDRAAVIEVVNGLTATRRLRQHYALSVEAGLAETIAGDLVVDADSPVAPTLEILLTKMWRAASAKAPHAPKFSADLYQTLRAGGLMLGDFVDQQLAALRETHARQVDSGLAIDILAHHTTPMITAAARGHDELFALYAHVSDTLPGLLRRMVDLYLLSGEVDGSGAGEGVTRLVHDTLAPHVRRRLAISDQPGPRARRVLENRGKEWLDGQEGPPLDDWDLAIVEKGLDGTRKLSANEEAMLEASRRMRARRQRARHTRRALGIAAVLTIAVVAVWAVVEKTKADREKIFTELSNSTDVVANLLAVEPVDGLMVAIAAVDRSYELLTGQVQGPLQMSLNWAVSETWETNLVDHGSPVTAVAVHPFGHMMAGGGSRGVVKLWLVPEAGHRVGMTAPVHEPLRTIQAHEQKVNALTFSPDGLLLATASDDASARLWRLDGTQYGKPLTGHTDAVLTLAFSPASDLLATAGADGTIRLWSRSGRALGEPIAGHGGAHVTALAFNRQGTLMVSGANDGTLRVWNVDDGTPVTALVAGHSGAVNAVAFSPEGTIFASGGADEDIRLWDVSGRALGVMREHEGEVNSLAFRNDGKAIVSGSADHTVLLGEIEDKLSRLGNLVAPRLRGIDAAVRSVAVSPDDKYIVVGSDDATIRTGDWLSTQVALPRRIEFTPKTIAFGIEPPTVIVAGYRPASFRRQSLYVERWRGAAAEGEVIELGSHAPTRADNLVLSSNAGVLVQANDKDGLLYWRIGDTVSEPTRLAVNGSVSAVAVTRDGAVIASASPSSVTLWSTTTASTLARADYTGDAPTKLAFSADGRLLAGASGACLRAWSIGGATRVPSALTGIGNAGTRTCLEGSRRVTALGVDDTGAQVAIGASEGTLTIWSPTSGVWPSLDSFKAHNGEVLNVTFRPTDNKVLLSSAHDGTVRIWQRDGEQLADMSGHVGPIMDIEFSPDGQTAASAGRDKTVRVWAAHWRQWLTIGCKRLQYHVRYRHPERSGDKDTVERARLARQACEKLAGIE